MNKREDNLQNGITLIALVITIIVMLILAGVSLNATIGDNGIITQAQNATYMQSIAALEEYFNNYYVEHYEEMSKNDESEVLTLTTLEPNWFYIPANEGIGGLRYIVDSEGHALYLIKKSGLPDEIKNQIKGGEAGEGTYADYAGLNDVYGLTSDLKVYYCSNGIDSIMGKTVEDLDADSPRRPVFNVAENSDIYNLLKDFDNTDGVSDGVLTAEEVKSVTKLTIDSTSEVTDFSMFYNLVSLRELTIDSKTLNNLAGIENCPQLNYVYFKSSIIADYSSLSKVKKLKYLYLYNIDDNELATLCNGIKDAQFSNLEYLAIVGNNNYLLSSNIIQEVNYNKSSKTISSISELSKLSDTTKKAVKYLAINNNNIIGDLNEISEFTSLILIRCEYNNLTSLDGLTNMNQLVYLCAQGNKIGTITNEDGNVLGESVETGTSISSLANKKSLYQVNLKNNSNLANVSYFKEDTTLKFLHLAGCSTTMNVNVISDRIIACGSNYSLPVKFLTGTVYNVTDYYTPAKVTYDELYSDLYGNTTITHLNLEGCTKINNTQFNTILSSMKQLKYLTLKDNVTLTGIEFINNNKVTGLIELDLRNTGVKGENSLVNLNEYAKDLKTLGVSDGSDFKNIITTINRLRTGGSYHYWCKGSGSSCSGLICSNLEVFKCLEGLDGLTNLYVNQWTSALGVNDTVIDLSKTSLKNASVDGIFGTIYLPSTIETVYLGVGIAVVNENSNKLISFSVINPNTTNESTKKFFTSLKNAPNLKELVLRRLKNLNVTSFEDYLKDKDGNKFELPSVTSLDISGYNSQLADSIISNLKGIEQFTNLETLTMYYTSRNLDISAISQCTKLKNVSLAYCNIQSLNGLESLNNLTTLTLKNNNISNLKPLENLINLTELNLENNAISDTATYTDTDGSVKAINNINILANLNKNRNGRLEKLYLSGNDNIVNWSPLSSLTWSAKSGW